MSSPRRVWVALIGAGIVVLLVVATRDVFTSGTSRKVSAERPATTTTTTADLVVEAPPTSRAPDTITHTGPANPTTPISSDSSIPSEDCQAGELALTTAVDRPAYGPGQTVSLVTTAKNISGLDGFQNHDF
jgi:hypothetical protein